MKKAAKSNPKSPASKPGDFPLRKTLYAAVTIFLIILAFNLMRPVLFPVAKNIEWGVSFSTKQALEYSSDPRANLIALLDDMKIRHFRLMSYWDLGEPTRGNYDFADLDWQINEVAKRGGTVSLAIGLRQPRWPECHAPEWALTDADWQNRLYEYVAKTVDRYKNNPAVTSWQLENEYRNTHFGLCDQYKSTGDRASDEMKIVKGISQKPVYMSLSDQLGLPVGQPTPDKYGMSIYGRFYSEPVNAYLSYPSAEWWHRLRSWMIGVTKHRETFIHEFQMEPWAKTANFENSIAEQDKSLSAAMIPGRFSYARHLGSDEIYLWGGEWWYWRMQHGDGSVWNAIKTEVAK